MTTTMVSKGDKMFHVNDNGESKPCRAKTPDRCKFYKDEGDTRHYSSLEEAQRGAEDIIKRDTGATEFHSNKAASYDYSGMEPKERTEKIAEDLEKAIDEIIASGSLHNYFNAIARNGMNKWSFNNVVIAGLQLRSWKKRNGLPLEKDVFTEINNMDACGAKQWAPRGRKITSGKGSALYIFAPMISKEKILDTNGKQVIGSDGKPKTRDFLFGYRSVAVFDKSQTDGDEIPENPIKLTPISKEVDDKYVDDMKGMIGKLGYSYDEREISSKPLDINKSTLGYTRPSDKSVVIDSRLSKANKAAVIAHELAHIQMGHIDKTDEYKQHRGRMETEAEGLAYMMMRRMGLDAEESKTFSPGYIAGWAKGDKEIIKSALNKVTSRFGKITQELGW